MGRGSMSKKKSIKIGFSNIPEFEAHRILNHIKTLSEQMFPNHAVYRTIDSQVTTINIDPLKTK